MFPCSALTPEGHATSATAGGAADRTSGTTPCSVNFAIFYSETNSFAHAQWKVPNFSASCEKEKQWSAHKSAL